MIAIFNKHLCFDTSFMAKCVEFLQVFCVLENNRYHFAKLTEIVDSDNGYHG